MARSSSAPQGVGLASLTLWLSVITLLLMVEFILLQAVAVGITTVVYSLIPTLEAGAQPNFDDWRRVFQVVSPTVTVSGGAGIVLSSILFARQAQIERQNAEAARAEAEAARTKAQAEAWAAMETAMKTVMETNAALLAELSRISERLERLESHGTNGNQATSAQ